MEVAREKKKKKGKSRNPENGMKILHSSPGGFPAKRSALSDSVK